MDEALKKSGDYPNIALTPGTNRHAATGEFVEIPASARMDGRTTIQITPYFADGEKYPNLIGVRAEGDEYETAYVKKSDMAEAVDYWRRMYEEAVKR